MANAKQVGAELSAFVDQVLRTTGLDVQAQMKKMTPVGNPDLWKSMGKSGGNPHASKVKGAPSQANGYTGGTLRASVTLLIQGDEALVSSNLPYAQRVYLEGHSKQLPAGEFQAFVASIPQRMEGIARELM